MTKPTKPAALVTGASSGIGAVYADRLAKRGHPLVLVARDKARLEALADRLRGETGVGVEVAPADLLSKTDLAHVERRIAEDASIGLLVNNAGVATRGTFLESDPDELERVVGLNVLAPTRLAAAAAKSFIARGGGAIINICSVLALAPERTNGAYGGSKSYLLNLSQALHAEAGARGLKVQAVLPGLTRTEIFDRVGRDMNALDQSRIMEVGDLVDAALAGFDRGELVTIPSLPEEGDWKAFESARLKLGPNLSRNRSADRYRLA
jgi:short-subunit dehydrogenase